MWHGDAVSLDRLAISFLLFTVAMLGLNTIGSERTLTEAVPLSLFQGVVFASFVYAWEYFRNRKK